MKQRDSFTGKDEVEVNCHGGIRVLISIYECIESTGAEGAPWTSLLSQSLENNKIDLVQKEALQEIVQAQTKLGVKVLLDQYAGALSAVLRKGLEIIGGIRQSLNKNESYHNGAVHPHLSRKRQLDNQSLNTIPSSHEGRPGGDNRLDENDAQFLL
jgi:tRNA modification GTPase